MRAAGALGFRQVMLWDVDTNDRRARSPAAVTVELLSEARRGSIVLMHTTPQSAAALPRIVAGLRARGLEPVDLGELLAAGTPVAR